MSNANLTPRQQKWFATVQANLEAKTGKSLAEWIAVAKSCPETAHRKQLAWLKEHHGLGVNHASYVLGEAFPSEEPGWDDAEGLRRELWKDPGSLAIFEAIERAVASLPGLVPTQRKGYSAFSKDVQFAAARPLKGGRALLGLKLDPSASPRLSPAVRRESWSERLTAIVEFDDATQVDAEIAGLLRRAWERG